MGLPEKVPTPALGHMPDSPRGPSLSQGDARPSPWPAALPGPAALPALSRCQLCCPAEEGECGLPQLPAEQIIPQLREASLRRTGKGRWKHWLQRHKLACESPAAKRPAITESPQSTEGTTISQSPRLPGFCKVLKAASGCLPALSAQGPPFTPLLGSWLEHAASP